MANSWYSINISSGSTGKTILNGYFSVNNITNVIQKFYNANNIGVNILDYTDDDYGANYIFTNNDFTYGGTTITSIPALDAQYNAIEWNLWINNGLSYRNYPHNWYDLPSGEYIYTFTPTSDPTQSFTCFKEYTKILTDKGYLPIETLKKGDLVKTLKHGFIPIDMIGKKEIYHPMLKERIKDQLYKCSQFQYPEIFEPLVITGCHSILVDSFISEEQKDKVIEVNGKICVTDNKYRLPACTDPRASVYEIMGNYTIYHLALENDDYYTNYGIYSNGLLVESCSKRYLKELSNMTLIE